MSKLLTCLLFLIGCSTEPEPYYSLGQELCDREGRRFVVREVRGAYYSETLYRGYNQDFADETYFRESEVGPCE